MHSWGWLQATAWTLLAVASEASALRLWAAAPDRNPLNSDLVTHLSAESQALNNFDLTHAIHFADTNAGTVPNGGQLAGSDLQLSISAEPAALTVGYLANDWLDFIPPATPLDADANGVLDAALPVVNLPAPVGNGDTVTYTLTFSNTGDAAANGVQVDLLTLGGLTLSGAATLILGDVAAQSGGSVVVTATVGVGQSAELNAAISDDRHGTYDWIALHQRIDGIAPTAAIAAPAGLVAPATDVVVTGIVTDASAIDSVDLEITTLPTGTVSTVACGGTDSVVWQCVWSVGNAPAYTIRARATDVHGNVGNYGDPVALAVDAVLPTVAFDAASLAQLQDGFAGKWGRGVGGCFGR